MFTTKSLLQRNKTTGFTLVEMMVVAPMLIIIIGTIIVSIVTLTGESLAEGGRAELINDVQDSLDRIESDVEVSGAYLSENNFELTSPQGRNDLTDEFVSETSTGNDVLIINSFATSANPSLATRSLVYLANSPFACTDANIAQNQVMTMNVIYFIKDSTLWRRTLAPINYTTLACSGVSIWQQPSCAADKMSSNTNLCKVQDEKLITGVTPDSFKVDYFLSASDTTPAPQTDDPDPDVRQGELDKSATVQITIKAQKTVAGRDISQQGTIRVTRVGSLVKYATPYTL